MAATITDALLLTAWNVDPAEARIAGVQERGLVQGTILVSEDEPAIAWMLIAVLEDAGYRVVCCEPGTAPRLVAEAPDVVVVGHESNGTFQAGWEAAIAFARIFPCAKLLMLSTSDAAVAEVGRTERGRRFAAGLRKPFSLASLLSIVNQLCTDDRNP